jgi:DNA polymerase I
MSEYVLDIEADNLYDLATKIHLATFYDINTEEVMVCRTHDKFKRFIWETKPSRIIGHNLLGYDLPLIRKLWGIPYKIGKEDEYGGFPTDIVDTFQLSSFLWPDRPGGHSLANLAALAGSHKDDFKGPWDEWSQEMEAYCRQDCIGNAAVYRYLLEETRRKYAT